MTLNKQNLTRISPYLWEIPKSQRGDMRVPVRVYADDELLEDALGDQSLEQAMNVASLPGLVEPVIVMPDVHQGYGMPIGGVMAARVPDGIISPGAVGYDINCGVRLLASHVSREEVEDRIGDLATALYHNCPSGVGSEGHIRLSHEEFRDVLTQGAKWALKKGYARRDDLEHTEEFGAMPGAQPDKVSKRAIERGRPQLGTLGAGNHFIEVDEVTAIFDEEAARVLGLFPGQIVTQVHCGSRGFGHQVCTDYVSQFQTAVRKYGIQLPDRELVCAPFDSPEGQDYFGAMACAANYAFANRQVLAHFIRASFEEVLAGHVKNFDLHQVYDIAHNMGKLEVHSVGGQSIKVCVHRKGATRAFGPGSEGLPPDLKPMGQPVLIPGSMGTASWVLLGTAGAMEQSFGSTCHGAGRVMSRSRAKKEIRGEQLRDELQSRGIKVRAGSMPGLAEEAPQAYKDVDRVIEVVSKAGIARKVARLEPVAVIKG
ncbi:MAG TPA: RtcB family protein [Anaerolineae bacterium]|nr:RtcB family protein [Anaerolineae bacterium]